MARFSGHRHGGPGARAVARYGPTRTHKLKEGRTFPRDSRGHSLHSHRGIQELPKRECVQPFSSLLGGERGLSGPSGPGHLANRGGMSG